MPAPSIAAMASTASAHGDKSALPMPGQQALSRVAHLTLQERVYSELRDALRSGRFMSGDPLTIRGLAELLGTSPMPVREAVRRLVQDKGLEVLPNRTMRVPVLTRRGFAELTEVRATLEGKAAFLAASSMTDAAFREIRAANERISCAIDANDVAGVAAANQAFHFSVYGAANSELLLSVIDSLWQRSGPYLAMLLRALSSSTDSLNKVGFGHHFEILAALSARNGPAAQVAMEADIRGAAEWYIANVMGGGDCMES